MATFEERRDERLHHAAIMALQDIHERGADLALTDPVRYPMAYGILRGYFEVILQNSAASFSEEQLGEIRIVLDQLSALTGEDYDMDENKKRKLASLAQALRESE